MTYQYSFCPGCGTRRVAYDYRCSVCGGEVRRMHLRLRSNSSEVRTSLKSVSSGQTETPRPQRWQQAA
jgi:hypothetical protein